MIDIFILARDIFISFLNSGIVESWEEFCDLLCHGSSMVDVTLDDMEIMLLSQIIAFDRRDVKFDGPDSMIIGYLQKIEDMKRRGP